jgi:predicted nuclease of restriction endonuclease-like (RecB) superfamily
MSDIQPTSPDVFYERIRDILESARTGVARTVNTAQVLSNWLIGRAIIEEEQQGSQRAGYGESLLKTLAQKLGQDYGKGFSYANLKLMRQFYLSFPHLLKPDQKGYAVRSLFPNAELLASSSSENWLPGQIHPNLSWTHYRTIMRVENQQTRAFYEIETLKNNWSSRELERQINSLLFERLAKSTDKQGLMQLATQGQIVQTPADVFKDPFVIEFLGLPESPRLVESDLETALIENLQTFLLELGKGFAFVKRQERITLDGDHFYIDLVFYHTILKCYILIDLKVGKLTHGDLGQIQLYVNYYDRERLTEGDNPTLGLILCSDKNDAVVKYTLGAEQQDKIFASRYQLYLPTEAELRRELEQLQLNLNQD